jgi:hypothetical protein
MTMAQAKIVPKGVGAREDEIQRRQQGEVQCAGHHKGALAADLVVEPVGGDGSDQGNDAGRDEDHRGAGVRHVIHQLEEGRHVAGGEIVAGAAADREQQVDRQDTEVRSREEVAQRGMGDVRLVGLDACISFQKGDSPSDLKTNRPSAEFRIPGIDDNGVLDVIVRGEGGEEDVLGLAVLRFLELDVEMIAANAANERCTSCTPGKLRCSVARSVASRRMAPSRRCSSPPPTMVWKIGFSRCVTASTWSTWRSARSP